MVCDKAAGPAGSNPVFVIYVVIVNALVKSWFTAGSLNWTCGEALKMVQLSWLETLPSHDNYLRAPLLRNIDQKLHLSMNNANTALLHHLSK